MDHYPFDTPPPDDVREGDRFHPTSPEDNRKSFDVGLSITRLVVGGLLWGMDSLLNGLLTWDTMRRKADVQFRTNPDQRTSAPRPTGRDNEPIVPHLQYQYSQRFIRQRDAVVGLIFASHSAAIGGLRQLDHLQRGLYRRVAGIAAPINQGWFSTTIRQRFEGLVQRGEQEVSNLERIGQREGEISRELMQTAVHETIEDYIEYLADHPEVKELVQTQSTGLADEAVEEIRERAVSADNMIEGLVRYFLRRMPRQEIPPPPSEVRERARRLNPERFEQRKL